MRPKEALLGLARMTGAFALFRAMNRRRILVLTYHRFSDAPQAGRTSAATLAAQLDYLASHYTVLPLSMIEVHLREGRPLPLSTAAVTIDAGDESSKTNGARPRSRRENVRKFSMRRVSRSFSALSSRR